MLKLTKTGIGLLTKQYRSVLRKCLLCNLGLFATTALLATMAPKNVYATMDALNWTTLYCDGGDNCDIIFVLDSFHAGGYFGTDDINNYNPLSKAVYRRFRELGTPLLYGKIYSQSEISSVIRDIMFGTFYKVGSWTSTESSGYVSNLISYNGANDLTTSVGANLVRLDQAINANKASIADRYTKSEVNNIQSLNYYYTFRVDERTEVIEFAKELRSHKKEMSSLDFMPIKSSSDLRINLIKAEDPLMFSAKTRDDSLGLMEVCHA